MKDNNYYGEVLEAFQKFELKASKLEKLKESAIEIIKDIELEGKDPRGSLGSPHSFAKDLFDEFKLDDDSQEVKPSFFSTTLTSAKDLFRTLMQFSSKNTGLFLWLFFATFIRSFSSSDETRLFASFTLGVVFFLSVQFLLRHRTKNSLKVSAIVVYCFLGVVIYSGFQANLYVNPPIPNRHISESDSSYIDLDSINSEDCLTYRKQIVTNLFVYDSQNKLLDDVKIKNQNGKEILSETGCYDSTGVDYVYSDESNNTYPLVYDFSTLCIPDDDLPGEAPEMGVEKTRLFNEVVLKLASVNKTSSVEEFCKRPIIDTATSSSYATLEELSIPKNQGQANQEVVPK